jgi:hypothetical protein
MNKRTVFATIGAMLVFAVGLMAYLTPAQAAMVECTATYVDQCTIYKCCPHFECVPINPKCKGPKCKCVDELVWECWYETVPDCSWE